MTAQVPLSRIVLASLSPRRLELLRSLGLVVEVSGSGYGEPELPGIAPRELATRHAREKLRAVLRLRPPRVASARDDEGGGSARGERLGLPDWRLVPVVAADTVVDLDGVALGKPRDANDAAAMLRRLSGREHLVHTAFALALPRSGEPAEESEPTVEERETTRVRFYRLDEDEIAAYVASGEPFDKAGGYGIQGPAAAMIESIEGDFYSVMGFPLARFVRVLRRLGFALPASNHG